MIYEFEATQDLHGYAAPWAPGAGKNLLEVTSDDGNPHLGYTITRNEDGTYTFNGTSSGASNFTFGTATLPAGTYVFSHGEGMPASFYLNISGIGNSTATGINFTIEEEATVTIRCFTPTAGTAITKPVHPMIRLSTSESGYAPYSNICQPEGFNIWDPTNQEYIQVYAGYVNANTRELYLRPVYEEYAGEELVGPWMSSLDPYEEDTTPTEGAFVIDFGGELTSYEITPFMLQTLLDSLGIRQHFTNGAGLLNSLMDQAQGRVRSEEELLHLSRPLNVIAIGDQLPIGLTFKPISKDVLPGLPGKFIR